MSEFRVYFRNWLPLLRKERSRLPHKIAMAASFYPLWKAHLRGERNALDDGVLWVNFEACRYIASLLEPGSTVFEYGSGGSTLFYAARAKSVVSVEHDETWFRRVGAAIAAVGVKNCERKLLVPETGSCTNQDPSDPLGYCSSDTSYRGQTFLRYVTAIDAFPDESFNFVAVDGRARPSCVYHARSKVTRGGYLMLDNSEREDYQTAKRLMDGWQKSEFYGPGPYGWSFWETTVWRRVLV